MSRYRSELELLFFVCGAERGYHMAEWTHPEEGVQRHWMEVGNARRYVDLVDWLGDGMKLEVQVTAVPRPERHHGSAGLAHCLWVQTEGRKQLDYLERFRPRPTIVLEHGDSTRRVALWALSRPLAYDWVVRANKRLAHRMGAPKKYAEPEFMFNPPGSCLRDGRSRPVLVRVAERNDAGLYLPKQVVGHLKEAPDADAWRRPMAAAA